MTDTATNNDDPGADVVGLTARRKADRKRIAAAFDRVARKHGARITATDEPASPGWHGAAIVLRGALAGVGFTVDIDDLHERRGDKGGLVSWYNDHEPGRPTRNFSARARTAVHDYRGRPHHKATSIGDWPHLVRQFDRMLALASDGRAFDDIA